MTAVLNGYLRFDHGRWHYELIEALGCSETLQEFCQDEQAVQAYLLGADRPQKIDRDGQLTGIDDAGVSRFAVPIMGSIEIAISAYNRQLVVVVVSITEAAIAEAFRVLFSYRPLVMKDLESNDQSLRLSVGLEDLVAASDLRSLSSKVIERAVSAATQGNKQSVLKRLERLFKRKLPSIVRDGYIALVDRRNRIVHDNWRGDLSRQEVRDYFDVGCEIVEELGRFVSARSLPIDDPMHLFDNMPSEPTEASD
ncbi:HEPN domain-containing protein [Burkholderia plantarii]|uniref:RiboL-PSP-HEPN domain-containing protein n=1 Tax=Burkholderia plantarii TaxID=41899 RepID=A0A0B6RYR7_BURPL|nr:HEPN domain-containing protein [Burkholderia plantarii]AJK46215.1 hypothetical protein BGL_1c17060 [Burkholderia plantarii]